MALSASSIAGVDMRTRRGYNRDFRGWRWSGDARKEQRLERNMLISVQKMTPSAGESYETKLT
jgi:hypothetical protein